MNLIQKIRTLFPKQKKIKDRLQSMHRDPIEQTITPERLARLLRSAEDGYIEDQMRLFEAIEIRDSHVRACLRNRKFAVVNKPLLIKPGEDSEQGEEIAKFVRRTFKNIPDLQTDLIDVLDAVGKGWNVSKIIWQYNETKRRYRIKTLERIPQECFQLVTDEGNRINNLRDILYVEEETGDLLPVTPTQAFLFAEHHETSARLSSLGVLRTCVFAYLAKKYAIGDWLIFAELYGIPTRIGKYNKDAAESDIDQLEKALRVIGVDGLGVISENTSIEIIDKARSSGDVHGTLSEFMNREISKAILGQSTTTDDGSKGTYGKAQVGYEIAQDIVQFDATWLAGILNNQIVKPLVDWQFGEQEDYPEIFFDIQKKLSHTENTENVCKLLEKGVPIKKAELYEKCGFTEPAEDDEVITFQQPQSMPVENSLIANAKKKLRSAALRADGVVPRR